METRGSGAPARPATAVADTYSTTNVGTLAVRARLGVLANDAGGPLQLVSHTEPSHGSLTVKPNGSFHYVPALGYTGTDTFTYRCPTPWHGTPPTCPPWARSAACR